MNQFYPVQKAHFLLLQHRPTLVPVVGQALLNLGCELSITSDSYQFFRQFNESRLNPFGIFGSIVFDGIILDLINYFEKSLNIVRELRGRFSCLPPVAGLCRPSLLYQSTQLQNDGFDDLMVIPSEKSSLEEQLESFLERCNNVSVKKPVTVSLPEDHGFLPVINLKTLGLFAELARIQEFPLDNLLNSFLNEMKEFISRLIRHFETGDSADCERLIISIRSLSGTLGASQMAQTARNMESCLKAEEMDKVGQWLPYLIEQFMVLKEFLEDKPAKAFAAELLV